MSKTCHFHLLYYVHAKNLLLIGPSSGGGGTSGGGKSTVFHGSANSIANIYLQEAVAVDVVAAAAAERTKDVFLLILQFRLINTKLWIEFCRAQNACIFQSR